MAAINPIVPQTLIGGKFFTTSKLLLFQTL